MIGENYCVWYKTSQQNLKQQLSRTIYKWMPQNCATMLFLTQNTPLDKRACLQELSIVKESYADLLKNQGIEREEYIEVLSALSLVENFIKSL